MSLLYLLISFNFIVSFFSGVNTVEFEEIENPSIPELIPVNSVPISPKDNIKEYKLNIEVPKKKLDSIYSSKTTFFSSDQLENKQSIEISKRNEIVPKIEKIIQKKYKNYEIPFINSFGFILFGIIVILLLIFLILVL